MTDKLRETLKQLVGLWRQRENNGEPMTDFDKGYEQASDECAEVLERTLAAAPQPMGCGLPCGFDCNGACFDVAAPQPAPETMAWAVVGEDGKIDPRKLWINSRDAEEYCERSERAVRVAIRVVKGGDHAS